MVAASVNPPPAIGIFARIFRPEVPDIPSEAAGWFLQLRFSEVDRNRFLTLSERVGEGGLDAAETAELDALLAADDLLSILRSKAQLALQRSADPGTDPAVRRHGD